MDRRHSAQGDGQADPRICVPRSQLFDGEFAARHARTGTGRRRPQEVIADDCPPSGRTNGWEGKLDVYALRGQTPAPTVIFIHGGGWVQGTKESSVLSALPYIAMGYSVVNVEYRLANVSLAPAAIEDCRCALRWVVAHAKDYNIDPARLIIAGASAGGHLALTTGVLRTSDGFDRLCQAPDEPKVAAIVNFFGIADVADLLDGPNKKPFPESWPYTVQWLGNQPNRAELAKAASPLT